MAEVKTYVRRPDLFEWPEDLGTPIRCFSREYNGKTWLVEHNLNTYYLIVQSLSSQLMVHCLYTQILDANHIILEFDEIVAGKLVIVALSPHIGVSVTFDQTTPATTWEIEHQFGSEYIISEFWSENGNRVSAESIEVTDTVVRAIFPSAISGKACLLLANDWIRTVRIHWDNIYGKPVDGFPPAAHTQEGSTIVGAVSDSDALGGKPASEYVSSDDIGVSVPSLDPVTGKIPTEFFDAGNVPVVVTDGASSKDVGRLWFTGGVGTGLFSVTFSQDGKTAVIATKPLPGRFDLTGNTSSVGTTFAIPSSSNAIRIEGGDGIRVSAPVLDTVRIDLIAEGGRAVFTHPGGLRPGDLWEIKHPNFTVHPTSPIQMFEEIPAEIGSVRKLNFIEESKKSSLYEAFTLSSSYVDNGAFSMQNRIIGNRTTGSDHHCLHSEKMLTELPYLPDYIYYSSYWGGYLLRVDEPDLGKTTLYVAKEDGTVTQLRWDPTQDPDSPPTPYIPFGTLPTHLAFYDSYAWRLRKDQNKVYLEKSQYLLTPSWISVVELPGACYDELEVIGFTVNAVGIYVLKKYTDQLEVWDRTSRTMTSSVPVGASPKYLSLHPDGTHIVATHTNRVYKGNLPSLSVSAFTAGVEDDYTLLNSLVVEDTKLPGEPYYHVMSVRADNELWLSTMYDPLTSTYRKGKMAFWAKLPNLIRFPSIMENIRQLAFSHVDLLFNPKVRILFRKGEVGDSIPAVLWRWSSVLQTFVDIPSDQIPTQGNTLEEMLEIPAFAGGEVWSYLLYVEIPDYISYAGVEQTFTVTFDRKASYGPIQIDSDSSVVEGKGFEVNVISGSAIFTNRFDRPVRALSCIIG